MRVLGVDPGLDGGLALISNGVLEVVAVMPTEGNGKKGGRQVDRQKLLDILRMLKPEIAYLEKVGAVGPRVQGRAQGVGSTWSFATSTESVHMGLVALGVPLVLVRPQEWQGKVCAGMPKGDPTTAALVVARRLWPTQDWLATPRSRTPHGGLVDAACIARYGYLQEGGAR